MAIYRVNPPIAIVGIQFNQGPPESYLLAGRRHFDNDPDNGFSAFTYTGAASVSGRDSPSGDIVTESIGSGSWVYSDTSGLAFTLQILAHTKNDSNGSTLVQLALGGDDTLGPLLAGRGFTVTGWGSLMFADAANPDGSHFPGTWTWNWTDIPLAFSDGVNYHPLVLI